MTRGTYYVVNEATEDRYDEVGSLDEALRIARRVAAEGQTGDPVAIEHDGRVIHQFVRTADGKVVEESVR